MLHTLKLCEASEEEVVVAQLDFLFLMGQGHPTWDVTVSWLRESPPIPASWAAMFLLLK